MRRSATFFLCLAIAGCSGIIANPHSADRRPSSRYPQHWWEPVPKNQAASWEILPQEANPGEVILSKRNELGMLSNFVETPFVFHGRYRSVEGEHYDLIVEATWAKICQNPQARHVLLRPRGQAAYPERYDDASIIPDENWKRLQPEHDDQEAPAAPDAIRLRRQDRPFDPALLLHGPFQARSPIT